MGIGVGIFLLAIGAILTFAVNIGVVGGVNVHAIGLILMAIGALGIVLSMVFWSSWVGPGYWARRRAVGPYDPAGPPTIE